MKNTNNRYPRRQTNKLALRRETIVQLTDMQLTEVVSGAIATFGPFVCGTGSQTC